MDSNSTDDLALAIQMFSGVLKNERRKRKLTQEVVAQMMKMDYRHYQNIENGKVDMKLSTLYRVTKFYDLEFTLSPGGTITCS